MTLLTQPPSTTAPSLHAGDSVCNALLILARILKRTNDIPDPSSSQPIVNDALHRANNAPLPRATDIVMRKKNLMINSLPTAHLASYQIMMTKEITSMKPGFNQFIVSQPLCYIIQAPCQRIVASVTPTIINTIFDNLKIIYLRISLTTFTLQIERKKQ